MPIVFAPPEPVAPQAAYAYGAAELGQRNNAVLADLYSRTAALTAQANTETARLQQQGAEARAQMETQRGLAGQHLQEQAREFDVGRTDRQAAQEFAYQHEAAQSQQRTQLAAWLNDQELSQKEEQRLRTMKNSVADIQADNDLSPDEKVAAVTKLKTGIDVYEMRQKKALAQQEQAHAAQYEAQAKRQTEVHTQNAALDAKSFEDRTVNTPTPEGLAKARKELGSGADEADVRKRAIENGDYTAYLQEHYDQYGAAHWRPVEGRGHAAKAKAAEDLDAIRLKDYSAAVAKAQKDVEGWAKQRDEKQAKLAEKAGTEPSPLTPDQIHQNFLDTLKARGLAETWEEQRARKFGGQARGDDIGGGDVPGPGSGQIPAALTKPFAKTEDASGIQKQQMTTWRQQDLAVRQLPIPEAEKQRYGEAVQALDSLLRKYGSVADGSVMTHADQARWEQAVRDKAQVEGIKFPGPAGPNISRFGGDLRGLVAPRR